MKIFRSISVIILSFLVLVSSTSFMIGLHICMGEVQNVALFTKADGCAREQNLPPCHRHAKAPCCEDESIVHQGTDLKAASDHFHLTTSIPVIIQKPLVFISEVIPSAVPIYSSHLYYDPPLRSCDLIITHQVFLI
jgi:hypothetical protein